MVEDEANNAQANVTPEDVFKRKKLARAREEFCGEQPAILLRASPPSDLSPEKCRLWFIATLLSEFTVTALGARSISPIDNDEDADAFVEFLDLVAEWTMKTARELTQIEDNPLWADDAGGERFLYELEGEVTAQCKRFKADVRKSAREAKWARMPAKRELAADTQSGSASALSMITTDTIVQADEPPAVAKAQSATPRNDAANGPQVHDAIADVFRMVDAPTEQPTRTHADCVAAIDAKYGYGKQPYTVFLKDLGVKNNEFSAWKIQDWNHCGRRKRKRIDDFAHTLIKAEARS